MNFWANANRNSEKKKRKKVSRLLLLWIVFLKEQHNVSPTSPPPANSSLFLSRCDVSVTAHVRNNLTWHWGDINCFLLWRIPYCSKNDRIIIPLWKCECCVTCWMCCFVIQSITLHASISSRNTEVHLLPNKSQSTAFLLYTSRHLACNLPVCWGDLWPPNDPNRRHACNCWGWRNDSNDSLFQYLFIHTLWNERDLQEHSAFDWTLAGWGNIHAVWQGCIWACLISKAIATARCRKCFMNELRTTLQVCYQTDFILNVAVRKYKLCLMVVSLSIAILVFDWHQTSFIEIGEIPVETPVV